MTTLAVEMLDQQLEFYKCEAEYAAARGGIGSGKTMSMVWWMLDRILEWPAHSAFVVGANYDQLRRGFFASMIGVLEDVMGWVPGKDFFYRETPTPMLRLATGGRIRSMSAELAQTVRSVEIQTLYLEEPATWHEGRGSDTYRVIMDRLRHSIQTARRYPELKERMRMTFNPPAVGSWLYKVIEERWKAAPNTCRCAKCSVISGFPCWRFPLTDNYLNHDLEGYLRRVRTNNPEDRWPVEIDGHWSTIGGSVYRGFNPLVHGGPLPEGFPSMEIDPDLPLAWALDFNVEHMASEVAQVYEQPRRSVGWDRRPGCEPTQLWDKENSEWQPFVFMVKDELFLRDSGSPDVVEEFLERYGPHCKRLSDRGVVGVRLYGDGTASGRSQTFSRTSAVRTNWDIVEDGLLRYGIRYEKFVQRENPTIGDRVNAVRTQFHCVDGFGLLVNMQRCPELVVDFQTVRWKPGEAKIDKSDQSEEGLRRTHASDALGYMIWVERCLQRGEPPTFHNYFGR